MGPKEEEKKKPTKPDLWCKSGDVSVSPSDPIKLAVSLSGEPLPVVSWSFGGKDIKPSSRYVIKSEGGHHSLTIDKAQPTDAGRYTMKAKNSQGEVSHNMEVKVAPAEKKEDKKEAKKEEKKEEKPS